MKAGTKYLSTGLLVLLLFAPAAFAQDDPPPEAAFTQQELDQILAPIALYPDSLLSHILMAATYPLEVVEAARWSRANPGLAGEDAVRAVEDRSWDPSVKSLVAFPRILAMMSEKLDWMRDLGDAFLAQSTQVMDTVQSLRRKAYAAGNLRSTEHYRVVHRGETIVIEPAYPTVVYVPYYDPRLVYGPWWWPGYPPVFWAPWPGYHVHPAFVGFSWSIGIFIGPRFFFGICDWHHRHIKVVHVHHRHRHVQHRVLAPHKVWRHNPHHRRGVAYRHPLVQQKFVHKKLVHPKFVRPHDGHKGRRDFPNRARPAPDVRRRFVDRPHTRPGHATRRLHDRRLSPHAGAAPSRPVPGAATRLGGATRLGAATRLHQRLPAVRSVPTRRDGAARTARPAPQTPQVQRVLPQGRTAAGIGARGQSGLHREAPRLRSAPAARSAGRALMRRSNGGLRGFGQFRGR